MGITFDSKVTYRDINLRDHVGVVVADDKRTASCSKLWLVHWSRPSDVVGVEHVDNLLSLDDQQQASDALARRDERNISESTGQRFRY